MANWWGNMSGAQAVEMGMNVFNQAQAMALQKQQEQQQLEQQKQENFFTKMQLDLRKQAIVLEQEKMNIAQQRLEDEKRKREEEFGFRKSKWQEELGFRREELAEKSKLAKEKATQTEKPDLNLYPEALDKAMNAYEETGNWGNVQAVQKYFGIPVDKVPGKAKEMKDAISVWKIADQEGLPLTVDRKFGPGGEEQSLPPDIINRYGVDAIEAMKKLTSGIMNGVLGSDKYRKYTISQIYEMYFRARRFINEGKSKEEVINQMKKVNIPEDLVNDIIGAL